MHHFDLTNKPITSPHRKKTTVELAFIDEPFSVETQEGVMTISPETVDDWDGGYFIAYPSDGSKPYSISPKFVRDNYVPVPPEVHPDAFMRSLLDDWPDLGTELSAIRLRLAALEERATP